MCSEVSWRPIEGFDGRYEISSCGEVRSWVNNRWGRARKSRLLRSATKQSGHRFVNISNADGKRTNLTLHALVAKTFIGPRPDGLEVCHGDGTPTNNCVENLRYDTHENNSADMVAHDRSPRGQRNGQAVLTSEQVVAIVAAVRSGRTHQRVAADYSVSRMTVSNIINGRAWGWLTGINRRELCK
jgi:hypothetical protein